MQSGVVLRRFRAELGLRARGSAQQNLQSLNSREFQSQVAGLAFYFTLNQKPLTLLLTLQFRVEVAGLGVGFSV